MYNDSYNGIEKRKFLRARFPCKISIANFPEHTVSTHTENISAGGVRVIIGEKIEIGSTVGLEMYLKEAVIACKGKVVWVVDKASPYKKGIHYYDTGIEFCDISDRDRNLINSMVEKVARQDK